MNINDKISAIQESLTNLGIDGWLMYDFWQYNRTAMATLDINQDVHVTRPIYYWVPKNGEPLFIHHRIEKDVCPHLPGSRKTYLGYEERLQHLKLALGDAKKVAMEVSNNNQIPYLSKVPSGVVDMIRSLNIEVLESHSILNPLMIHWDEAKLASHRRAAEILKFAYDDAFQFIHENLVKGQAVHEADVVNLIAKILTDHELEYESEPSCCINANAANPHYQMQGEGSQIQKGDLILIDLWGKEKKEKAAYADITVMAMAHHACSDKQRQVFDVVRKAQQTAFDYIEASDEVTGAQVDHACRRVIIDAGFGEHFIHRTGHNLDTKLHGDGTHLDSFETLDNRRLLPATCFTVEPGIYLEGEFGVRLEADVYLHADKKLEVTTPLQDDYYFLF